MTYGSLGGIIVTLFFFYISAVLFIFGAELNSVLRMPQRKAAASTSARPGPFEPWSARLAMRAGLTGAIPESP